ncbi:peptidoglycan DD-metalloendopeptidase family protein [Micromonospora terminaliae]|uniref:M23 family metallopeptidase n=1 Tax=Micromonospora terminaliae TaxID=1914461 RepID=A0AAJ2ZMT7_9ACTN|nr:M23 family metallopeptidase [Micromonospora terminaliae]NES31829.1 M23 family metallopeptidase [Micromonospora terminaliae]QGL49913.1 peptidoglycan DD-metalloendopeptidase family protein [Micromonospora terminaliae]
MRSPSIGRRARPAYPVLLLVAALAAGCAPDAGPTAEPGSSWQGPTAVASSAQPAQPTGPVASPTPSPAPSRTGSPHVFPVRAGNVDYHPTHSAYPGTDIFADCGEPVVAVTDGVILEVSRVDRFSKRGPLGPNNGGLSVSLLGDDGVRYYGSHLSAIATGVDAGVRVRAGQQLGKVGHTGNANNVCHLHFGLSPKCTGHDDWWIRRGVVWPAKYLDSWRKRGNRSPAAEVAAWQRRHGCPKAPSGSAAAG